MSSRSAARTGPLIKTGVKNVDIAGAFKVRQKPAAKQISRIRQSRPETSKSSRRNSVIPPSTRIHKPGQFDGTGLKAHTHPMLAVDGST